jgi:quercetin dioxygenase-like cupin family protein
MKINHEFLSTEALKGKPDGYVLVTKVMENEIEEVYPEYITIRGPWQKHVPATIDHYDVLLSLGGTATLKVGDQSHAMQGNAIAKIPFNTAYELKVGQGNEFYCLLIRKQLNDRDRVEIEKESEKHSELYFRAFSECPAYTEEIKSPKTLNRMILPERLVPSFCIGTVETAGPEEGGAHEHPMLEQLFLGLPGCKCTVYADDASIVLTENMIMHIPLGSMHSVKVAKGDNLSYVWLDFFKTIEGQDYIGEQHKVSE